MEGIGTRIEADVGTDCRVSNEALIEPCGDVVNETALSEVAEEL
jgi:hypothetical protein